MKANFDKCIRDYLEAVAGFPNIGNQLICWLRTAKKACSHANARVRAALSAASQLPWEWLPPSNNGLAHGAREEWTNLLRAAQGAPEQVCQLEQDGTCQPTQNDCFLWAASSNDKAAGILDKIARDKKQPKIKRTAHVPTARSHELSYKQHRCHKYRNYHQSNRCDCNGCQPDYCHWDDQLHDRGWCATRTRGTASPTTRRMIASAITSRKRVMRPCTMTSPLHWAPAICPEKGVDLDLLCALALVLALAQAAGATKIIMSNNMIASQAQRPNADVRTLRTTMMNITIA